jgi:hypothetical protein
LITAEQQNSRYKYETIAMENATRETAYSLVGGLWTNQ